MVRRHGRSPARGKARFPTPSVGSSSWPPRGRINRQIAAGVRASEKTVGNSLTRVFAKAGCHARVDLATVHLADHLDAMDC
ncbi:LuxR C-terminal-related transcriptional regulator [Kutzneria buriramensis]|uniref:LuxR C-terminal-related transcriptional regulator n=1 Tax=Kutzneria buriramensis TaxID=1045776 RepID=UPI000E25EBEC